jgi:hypothetical protein
MVLSRLFAVLLLLFALSLPSSAQETTGSIVETVLGSSGSTMPGVAVIVISTDRKETVRTVTTDSQGEFVATLLPVGKCVHTGVDAIRHQVGGAELGELPAGQCFHVHASLARSHAGHAAAVVRDVCAGRLAGDAAADGEPGSALFHQPHDAHTMPTNFDPDLWNAAQAQQINGSGNVVAGTGDPLNGMISNGGSPCHACVPTLHRRAA